MQQLLWSRFVNFHGRVGKNVPLDLHMEHINATHKNSITALGANKTEESILRLGRCIGQLQTLLANFDDQHNVSQGCGKHSQKSFKTDLPKVVEMLKFERVFMHVAGRKNQKVSISSPLSWNLKSDFVEWMKINILSTLLNVIMQ